MADSARSRLHEGRRTRVGSWVRRHPLITLAIYAALVIASNIVDGEIDYGRSIWAQRWADSRGAQAIEIDAAGLGYEGETISYRVVVDGDQHTDRVPVLLLHGSPGGAVGFDTLGPALADISNRPVISFDLPGFVTQAYPNAYRYDDLSARTIADLSWRILDELDVERAHIVGWSNGGAVALHMADEHPERAASLTMLASVGVQETEGSGSHFFEHAKYKLGKGALVYGAHLIPHFGILGPPAERYAFLKNFDDTDQRPLRGIMAGLDTPTLILHGRHDFLTPAWGAELHHEVMPTSRLVMLDSDHFMPFMAPELAAGYIAAHASRHDTPGVEPITTHENLAPVPDRSGPAWLVMRLGERVRSWPWWILVLVIAALASWKPECTTAFVGLLVGRVDLDIGVALVGLVLGRSIRKRRPRERRGPVLGALAIIVWSGVSLVIASGLGGLIDRAAPALGGWAIVPLFLAVVALLWTLRLVFFREGRQRMRAWGARLRHHEWWPAWVIYLPIVPMFCRQLARPGGIRALTAINPGMGAGGGIKGESKADILRALSASPETLAHVFIDHAGSPEERTARADTLVRTTPDLGGYPVVCKPNAGERGVDVCVARTQEDLRAFFSRVRTDAILQRFHPGPSEIGVFWQRRPEAVRGDLEADQQAGEIVAITRKTFPTLTGNGRWTIRRLLFEHPRARCQIDLHLRAFEGRLAEVPADGEAFALTTAGNHARGCVFTDGFAEPSLATPELNAAVDRIARTFRDDQGRELDSGRFDLRYADEDALRAGRGFGVVEVNGVTSEPTNMYDPVRSFSYASSELRKVWRRVFELGEARIAHDGRMVSWREIIRAIL